MSTGSDEQGQDNSTVSIITVRAELHRLRYALQPNTETTGEYKHGYTNGVKFALKRVGDFLAKVEAGEPGGRNELVCGIR